MIISIIVFSLLPRFDSFGAIAGTLLRLVTRLALMPVVAGLSYEVIKLAGRSKNKCVCVLSKPGLWLQRLTTREPDDAQIEVAIESMKPCIPENKEDDKSSSRYSCINAIIHSIQLIIVLALRLYVSSESI